MTLKGKTVFVPDTKTGKVNKWTCIGEFSRTENGRVVERLCYLMGAQKYITLPKRRVFETREAARVALIA